LLPITHDDMVLQEALIFTITAVDKSLKEEINYEQHSEKFNLRHFVNARL
jgi:hypothetical protein